MDRDHQHCLMIDRTKSLGQLAYEAYCNSRSNRAFDGSRLPEWSDVPPDIQGGWVEAARVVSSAVLSGHVKL